MPARTSRRLDGARYAAALLFWCVCALAFDWMSPEWRRIATPALLLPVLALTHNQGILAGALHGAAAAAVGLLHLQPGELTRDGWQALLTASLAVGVGCLVGILNDRTRRSVSQRRASEDRYLHAARTANDGLWDWDLRNDRIYYSERWHHLVGSSNDETGATPEEWLDRIHPADVGDVRTQLREHIEGVTNQFENEHRIRCPDGSWSWVSARGMCTRDDAGRPRRVAGWLADISERKIAQERLRQYAFHDALTGLPNRELFMDRLLQAIIRLRRRPESRLAVVMLDLDRFKNVNDSMGHLAGDELLCQVARRIENWVQAGDTIARLGGDEFVILIEELEDMRDVDRAADLLQRTISAPITLGERDLIISASIGIAVAGIEVTDPTHLLRDADQAMYRAKRQGRGRHVVFDERFKEPGHLRLSLETALRSALEHEEVGVEYQPIVDLKTGRISGFEAFARWQHPQLGRVSPRDFVNVAEDAGLIHKLGAQVLSETLQALQAFNDLTERTTPYSVAVNVSFSELTRANWLQMTLAQMQAHNLAPGLLHVEVTEDALMQNAETGHKTFEHLREQGLSIYMDDFGTGYSSLSYLRNFPVDALKIDESFVARLHDDSGAEEIVRAVIGLAHDLDLRVIAEGVERAEHLQRLRDMGCHAAQGFYFAAPASRREMAALLRSDPHW